MKKTILLLLMFTIITSNLLTACGPDVVDPNVQKVVDDSDDGNDSVDVEVMDSDAGQDIGEDSEKQLESNKDVKSEEAKVEDKIQDAKSVDANVEDKPVEEQPKVEEPKEPEVQPAPPVAEPEPVTLFIDGSYAQTGSYQSPAGPETINVSLTLKADTVTDVIVTPNASHPNSQKFQGLFASGISAQVVGKKLDQIGGFSQVNGSSLTPTAFNQALALIKAEAKK